MGKELAKFDKGCLKNIETTIKDYQEKGMINFPSDYSVSNALKSAWLVLQKTLDRNKAPVLNACTKESISNCLMHTIIGGLSPAKNQIYYIAYGKELTPMRSYHGTKAMLKRIKNVIDVNAEVIFEKDKIDYLIVNGVKSIREHKQDFINIDTAKIIGAYAVIEYKDKEGQIKYYTEIMNKKQIDVAWSKSKSPGTQKEFPEEMSKRTVINRAAKHFVNTSDDSDLFIKTFYETSGDTFEENVETIDAEVSEEVKENQSKQTIEINDNEKIESPAEEEEPF